jgi:hypothetical protein
MLFVFAAVGTLLALGAPERIKADAAKASRVVLCTTPMEESCQFKRELTSCSPKVSTYGWFVKCYGDSTALQGKSLRIDYPEEARLKQFASRQIACKIYRNEQEPWFVVVEIEGRLIIARESGLLSCSLIP